MSEIAATMFVILFLCCCRSEGGAEKIGWLYKPNKPDAEDYLLGKRIDKNVDRDLEKETKNQGLYSKDQPDHLYLKYESNIIGNFSADSHTLKNSFIAKL